MESYRILYRIRIGHDYFDGKPCPALQCRLTPQGEALAHRRGLLFRQTAPGEWTLLFRQEPDTIVKGSATVMINGRPAARMGDTTAHGGSIVAGCPTVMIGG